MVFRREIFPRGGSPEEKAIRPVPWKRQTLLLNDKEDWSLWRAFSLFSREIDRPMSHLIFEFMREKIRESSLTSGGSFPTAKGKKFVYGLLILGFLDRRKNGATVDEMFTELTGSSLREMDSFCHEKAWGILVKLHGSRLIRWEWGEGFFDSVISISDDGEEAISI